MFERQYTNFADLYEVCLQIVTESRGIKIETFTQMSQIFYDHPKFVQITSQIKSLAKCYEMQ